MIEPQRIPLHDNPVKKVTQLRLWADSDPLLDDIKDEDNTENNSQSIPELEAEQID